MSSSRHPVAACSGPQKGIVLGRGAIQWFADDAMFVFEPLKLVSVGLVLLLLTPFGVIFWLLAAHTPRSETVRRAQLETSVREASSRIGANSPDGTGVGGVRVEIRESVAFSPSTAPWLSFYPRKWVGWLGLVALATIAFCIVFSLFFPGSSTMSAS